MLPVYDPLHQLLHTGTGTLFIFFVKGPVRYANTLYQFKYRRKFKYAGFENHKIRYLKILPKDRIRSIHNILF
jgi:hypothetical protein